MLIDSLAKLNSASRNAISAALVVIVAIAMYNWTVSPHVVQLSVVQQYESVLDDVVKKNKILSSAVKIKNKKLEQLGEQFAQLQSSLFMIDKAKEFFSDLQVISEQMGCTVYSLNLTTDKQNSKEGQAEDATGIVTKSAILSVIGAYGDIVRLVERLQARPQKVWIDSVKMTSLDNDSGQLKCDITITICTLQDKEAIPHE